MSHGDLCRLYIGEIIRDRNKTKARKTSKISNADISMPFSSLYKVVSALKRCLSKKNSVFNTTLYTLGRLTFQYLNKMLQILKNKIIILS